MSPRQGSQALALLVAMALFYVLWDAGRPFSETDDFWCAEITTRMLESGDLVVPRFGPRADYNKPPLFYWVSLPAAALLPDLEAAMRLVPGLALGVLLWLVYREVARVCDRETGLIAAAILALTYDHLHVHGFRSGVPDGLLTLQFAAVAFLALRRREQPLALLAAGALVGTAFLTKTAMAVVPAALVGAALWMDRRDAPARPVAVIGSALVAIAVVLPWFWMALAREGSPLLEHMFLDQILNRFLGSTAAAESGRVFGRSEPLYALRHYLTWGQPWSLISVPAFALLWLRRAELSPAVQRLSVLCGLWFGLVLGLMSASRAVWPWYAASVHVPAAIAVGLALREFTRTPGSARDRWLWAPLAASTLLLQVPLAHDPYLSTSGPLPLDPGLWLQLAASALLALVLWNFWGHERVSPKLACAALPALVVLAFALHSAGARVEARIAGVAAFVVAAVLGTLFDGALARRVGALTLALMGGVYLAAPLRHAGRWQERSDIRAVRTLMDSGFFDGGRVMQQRTRVYAYIRLYQAFSDELDVRYDDHTHLLTLRSRQEAR